MSCDCRDADEAMLVQAIQASLMEAGEGHDGQPASAGAGATPSGQPAGGPDLKVQHTLLDVEEGPWHERHDTLEEISSEAWKQSEVAGNAHLPHLLVRVLALLVVLRHSRW